MTSMARAMKAIALLVYVHTMDFFGLLFLVWAIAARRGQVNLVKTLLATRPSRFRLSVALSAAAENGHGDVVEVLLDHGANPNALPGVTHFAVFSGSVRAVEALLAAGARVNAAVGEEGNTPLHFAAMKDNPAMIRSLLAAGANSLATTSSGTRPADEATAGSEAAALLSAAAEQALVERTEATGTPPVPMPVSAPGPVVHAVDDDLPFLPPVARGDLKIQMPTPPRNSDELRKQLAHLDAIEDRGTRAQIDIARERVERGLLPMTSVSSRLREWVDEGPTLAFAAPRQRAEPEQGLDVDPTVAALARLCDTILERYDPPIKWMVENPEVWRDRDDQRIGWLLFASPRNIAVHDGRYSPKTLARAMSYLQSCDPDDSDGRWLTAVRDVLHASRGVRAGERGRRST